MFVAAAAEKLPSSVVLAAVAVAAAVHVTSAVASW